jgi:eukaryotic-like serine/threonine-protein kinase
MELTVQNVYGLILRSKLLAVDDARTMYARWQAEAKDAAGDLTRFASWLTANKYVTEYQASLLVRGHAEGFFLNDYKILDRLGKGRMAGVYKAQHRLGQIFAIKVLPPSRASEANFLGRFQREAKLAMRLKHPNVVRAFQVGQAGSLYYLVMEYLEGETLEDVLTRRKKMPPAEAVRLVFQSLQGLQHIHAQGLVHRDLKPANLMLIGGAPDSTLRATVKLLDIGLGRVMFEEAGSVQPEGDGLTGEGVLLGTPDYMSPEQARDPRAADIRSDIYSLGCVLYHALAGQPPFPDTNIISQMIRHATEAPKPLKELNPAVPDGLQQIVNWMLAKDPAGRYPTPERAAQALQIFLAAGAEKLQAPESDPSMQSYLSWLQVQGDKSPPASVNRAEPPTIANIAVLPVAPTPKGTAGATPPLPSPVRSAVTPSAGSVPQARPPKLPRPARPPGDAEKHEQGAGKRRHKKKHRSKSNLSLPPPTAGAAPAAINVELVPMPPPSTPTPERLVGPPFTRRDFVTFGIGVGAGALVTLLGCLVAVFGRRTPPPPPQPPEDTKDKPKEG